MTDSKSVGGNTVWVRVPPPAPYNKNSLHGCFCFILHVRLLTEKPFYSTLYYTIAIFSKPFIGVDCLENSDKGRDFYPDPYNGAYGYTSCRKPLQSDQRYQKCRSRSRFRLIRSNRDGSWKAQPDKPAGGHADQTGSCCSRSVRTDVCL